MRITALYVRDFKRLHDIELRPDADRAIILIGGKNANGKSSLLDALSTAFGGKKQQPDDPVRHGADEATIRVELDDGELEVRRVIQPGGESLLEVRDRLGAVSAPQTVLNKLVGARFLDPLAFLSLAAKDQAAALMKVIPGAERIGELNAKRKRAFDRRTEVGRDLTKAEGELARLPEVAVEAPIAVAALAAERAGMSELQQVGAKATARKEVAVRATQDAVARRVANDHAIKKLEAQLAELRAMDETLSAEVQRCEEAARASIAEVDRVAAEWLALAPRRAALDADFVRADAHNRAVFAAEAQNKRHAQARADVEKLTREQADLTKVLDTIDTRKAEILAAAALPVPGLAIADDGIELAGVPFDQASDAEQWRVALALVIAASPGLDDVWIRDGALLDDESLALVAEQSHAAGKRPWIERVGTRDPGVIEIRDGRVVMACAPELAVTDGDRLIRGGP